MKFISQCAVLVLLSGSANLADAQTPIEIPDPEASAHRVSRVNFLRAPHPRPFETLALRIDVDRNGSVTSLKVMEGPEELREAATVLAKTWRYKPFERDGQAVPAAFTAYLSILPPERPVIRNVPFPALRQGASVKITLQRTACLVGCPEYQVQIDGSGDVLFHGTYPLQGERRRHISRETLEGLLEVFRKANYFSLDRQYRLEATDWPTCLTSISFDGQSMSVNDYGGLEVGMPASVSDVEEAIDEAASTHDWLKPRR